jgi:hypothetical protein
MLIGFDLDGVLCDYDDTLMHLLWRLPDDEQRVSELHYFSHRRPLMDPTLLCHGDDEFHVITGRNQGLRNVTLRWCARHVPGAAGVHVVGGRPMYNWPVGEREGLDPEFSLKGKRDKILELGVEVFFDDNPGAVRRLREMLPGVAVVQYGGELESEHPPTGGT